MSLATILKLAFAGLGTAIALATAAKAYMEYLQQGVQRRAQMFFDLRHRLQERELAELSELIDEALCLDQETADKAQKRLSRIGLRTKRDYLGLFEEVALAMKWRLITPSVAHYMFGYYALNCRRCPAFWFNVNQGSIYWSDFYAFCDQMQLEDVAFRHRLGSGDDPDLQMIPASVVIGNKNAPAVNIKIPPVLRQAVEGQHKIVVHGRTVGEALIALANAYPAIAPQLFSERNPEPSTCSLNRYINVYLNDEDVRVLDGLQAIISGEEPRDGHTIVFLPPVAGGE
jgi:molybdopterin converting factor small subunit